MNHRLVAKLKLDRQPPSLTVLTRGEVDNISYPYIDDSQEALILLLEFLLVEYLDGEDAVFRGTPTTTSAMLLRFRRLHAHKSKLSFQYGFKVLLITVVVLVCSPLRVATANGSGNPIAAISWGSYIRKNMTRTEHIALVETVSRNDYILSVLMVVRQLCGVSYWLIASSAA